MTALGEILELLHDAAERGRPARLTVDEWRHGPRSSAAFERFMAQRFPTASGAVHATGEGAMERDETTWTTTLAFESPERFRESSAGTQAGKRYLVRDGDRWLSWDADWGTATHETESEHGALASSYAFLLDPVALASALRLEPAGTTRVAGRAALSVRATSRPGADAVGAVLFRVGPGADVLELAIDAERGVLLRSEAFLGGEPFHRLEVTEIAFGPIDPAAFEVAPPEGAGPATGWHKPRRLPLHELATAAPFPVFVPASVPDGWRLVERLLTPGRDRPRVEPEVTLVYASRDGAYEVTVRERAAEAGRREWLRWERDGELEVADAGTHAEPRHHVRVERDGTLVELSGADSPLLASLARSLVAAPTEPPRIDA